MLLLPLCGSDSLLMSLLWFDVHRFTEVKEAAADVSLSLFKEAHLGTGSFSLPKSNRKVGLAETSSDVFFIWLVKAIQDTKSL